MLALDAPTADVIKQVIVSVFGVVLLYFTVKWGRVSSRQTRSTSNDAAALARVEAALVALNERLDTSERRSLLSDRNLASCADHHEETRRYVVNLLTDYEHRLDAIKRTEIELLKAQGRLPES